MPDLDLSGGPFWIGTALAVGLVAAVLLASLTRGERALVSRKVAGLLLALRLLAAGLLALLLAEPVLGRAVREPARGKLIVAVDVSESMRTVDRDRHVRERGDLAKLLEVDSETASRGEIARRLLDGPRSPLAKLAEDHDLEYLAFAASTTPTSRPGLLDRLASTHPDAAGDGSDWRPALAEAARARGVDEPPTVGVVLVSDGRFQPAGATDHGGSGGDPTAELARRKIPVFPVVIGSEKPPHDLAVADLFAPETAFLDDTAPVDAALVMHGFAGRAVAVTLTAKPVGKPAFTSTQTIHPTTDHDRRSVRFQVPLNAPGAIPVHVELAPATPGTGSRAQEARAENNRADRIITVTGEPARVLLIDGEPRWEFRYLRNALMRDPRVKVEAIVLHQPAPELPPDRDGAADRRRPVTASMDVPTFGTTLPPPTDASGEDPIGRFDAIILGDVASADLPSGFWERLDSQVAERGGTLIITPGPIHWGDHWGTAAGGGGPAPGGPSIAAALSPLIGVRPVTVDEAAIDPLRPTLPPGVPIVPTSAALAEQSAWPMFRLRDQDAPDALAKLWGDLPRQPWALVGRPKPGAAALAVTPGPDGGAVIASQPFGLGRVFWVGVDGTWRWRYGVGDALHHRFWGQTVRWASTSAKLMAGDQALRFGVTRTRVEAGEPVPIRARIGEGVANLPAQPILAARVLRVDDSAPPRENEPAAEVLVPLRSLAGQPRTFEGKTPPLGPGRYKIRLEAPGFAEGRDAEATFQVVPRATGERLELAASRTQLESLANLTGGRVLADHEAGRIPESLRPFARSILVPKFRVIPLWDKPAILAIMLAILALEWVVRKSASLP